MKKLIAIMLAVVLVVMLAVPISVLAEGEEGPVKDDGSDGLDATDLVIGTIANPVKLIFNFFGGFVAGMWGEEFPVQELPKTGKCLDIMLECKDPAAAVGGAIGTVGYAGAQEVPGLICEDVGWGTGFCVRQVINAPWFFILKIGEELGLRDPDEPEGATTPSPPICGNNVKEGNELCDPPGDPVPGACSCDAKYGVCSGNTYDGVCGDGCWSIDCLAKSKNPPAGKLCKTDEDCKATPKDGTCEGVGNYYPENPCMKDCGTCIYPEEAQEL